MPFLKNLFFDIAIILLGFNLPFQNNLLLTFVRNTIRTQL